MVGEVYLIENKINNHKYIGQTTQGYLNRFKQHIQETQYGDTSALHNAIRKWGEDNFKVELIETCDLDQLDEREIYWISFYNIAYRSFTINKWIYRNCRSQVCFWIIFNFE